MTFIGNPSSGKVHTSDCCYAAASFDIEPYVNLYDALSCGYEEAACCLTDRSVESARIARATLKSIQASDGGNACCVCGHSRRVERAHLVPRHAGGARTAPLCPNCHQAFDYGQMSPHELKRLADYCKRALGMSKHEVNRCHGWGRLRHEVA